MIIAQISDTHIDPDHENGPARLRDLEVCIADINALDPAPDVVIHTGDLAHNGDGEKYHQAFSILETLKAPLLACPGNRDERSLLRSRLKLGRPFAADSPFLEYVVDDFPVRLVGLDTLNERSNQGAYCQERTARLQMCLAAKTSKPTAVFMHHPPYEIGVSLYPRQYAPWAGAKRVASALRGNRHVVRGLCGHAHRHTMGSVARIPFSTVPSIARDLRLGEFEAGLKDVPLYHLHTFDGVSAFRTELRAATGSRSGEHLPLAG